RFRTKAPTRIEPPCSSPDSDGVARLCASPHGLSSPSPLRERPRRGSLTHRLFGQPHSVELLVQEVGGGDGPSTDLGVVRHDAVPLEGIEVVDLLVKQPLLEGAEIPLALLGIHGARLL